SFLYKTTATTHTYTLSLHDALPILRRPYGRAVHAETTRWRSGSHHIVTRSPGRNCTLSASILARPARSRSPMLSTRFRCEPKYSDRKSTRLNSSHVKISYAVFCLKK